MIRPIPRVVRWALLLGLVTTGHALAQGAVEPLPGPLATECSVEACLNSRCSAHGLSGTADLQQIGHVLWATGKAPIVGAYRHVWVATPTGTYLYDPAGHALILHKPDKVAGAAFAITCEAELAFDAGVAYMPAILAAVSLWGSGGVSVVSCPQGTQLCFGVQQVTGLTSERVAHCSVAADDPGWLPDPSTTGCNRLEHVLDHLRCTDDFAQTPLTLSQISQILWAGYGCTPHTTYNGKSGLTVPSAYALYYLSGAIYVVDERGVYRYLNRTAGDDPATRDHRMECIRPGDFRRPLRDVVAGLPQAPCCVVLCLPDVHSEQHYAQLEVGFVAGNMLLQASALDLGCYFNARLSAEQRRHVQSVTGIPDNHIPQAITSIGPVPRVELPEVQATMVSSDREGHS